MTNIRRTLLLLVAALLLPLTAACGGGGTADGDEEGPTTAAPTAEAVMEEEGEEELTSDSGGFNPLSLLTTGLPGLGGDLSGFELSEDVDPSLRAALIQEEDLPEEFGSFGGGEFSFAVPTEEGTVDMTMAMFFSGDTVDTQGPFAAVMSAVMALPPDVLEETLANLPSGEDAEEEIKAALGEAGDLAGVGFFDVEVLDASGLGEEGLGLRMVMDFSELLGGLLGDEEVEEAGITFDMYMFTRSGRMLMLAVMWSSDQAMPVDGKGLAEIMDERAEEAF